MSGIADAAQHERRSARSRALGYAASIRPGAPRPASSEAQPLTIAQACDLPMVFLCALLMMLGVVMVSSATFPLTPRGSTELLGLLPRQLFFAGLGFAAMLISAQLNYRWWLPGSGPRGALHLYAIWLAAVLLLLALQSPLATIQFGATRSIALPGGISFQPAEVAKVVMVLLIPALAIAPGTDVRSGRRFVLLVALGGTLAGLVAIEDFGTGALLAAVLFALLGLSGARWLHLGGLALLGLLGGAGYILARDYRRQRILNFFSDEPDLRGAGYQINQAKMAIASGEWWGLGLGAGRQKHDYLPQDHNDFIFAIICEELGIVGGLVIVGLFVLFVIRGGWIVRIAPDAFGRLLATGCTLMIGLQAAFNLGVVTNSVPTKGISLPFVSAGGSGVVFLGILAGLIAAVGTQRPVPTRTPTATPAPAADPDV